MHRIGEVLLQKGDAQAALAEMQQESRTRRRRLTGLAMAYHALGQRGRVRCRACELIKKYGKHIALLHRLRAGLSAAKPTAPSSGWTRPSSIDDPTLGAIAVDPLFANIHSDPRWLPFLRKTRHGPRAARGDQVRREGAELVEAAHRSSDGCP